MSQLRFGNRSRAAALAFAVWTAAGAALAASPVPADAPEFAGEPGATDSPAASEAEEGRRLFESKCSECHELQYATQLRNTPEAWTQVVGLMISNGMEANDEQKRLIISYLSETFAPGR